MKVPPRRVWAMVPFLSFGTLSWLLPENQQRFPCYVLAPQTDRGWIRYKEDTTAGVAKPVAGFGDGAKLALEIVDKVRREFAVDERRIYVAGQSMGGAGVPSSQT